jgi:DNA polymerase-3 subunit epsilon
MDILQSLWCESTLIAIDLETTGKYPLDAEICEMAAVKWKGGQVVETFQTLCKPRVRMSDFVISIHNITNEMCETAPTVEEKLAEFHKFIGDGVLLAHQATFDMGFLAWEFEKAGLRLPSYPAFCTSKVSQAVNSDVPNHRLATLAQHFGVNAGAAHRAFDDAMACLNVAIAMFEKLGRQTKNGDIQTAQGTALTWDRFSVESLTEREHFRTLVRALRDKREVIITYQGGSRKGEPRKIFPMGLVRQPDNDFLVATAGNGEDEEQPKRFFLDKISSVQFA